MKKTKALEALNRQLNDITFLKTIKEEDKQYQEWKTKTLAVVKSVFGEDSSNYENAKDNLFPNCFFDPFDNEPNNYHKMYVHRLETQHTLLRGMITEIELWNDDKLDNPMDSISTVQNICSRFHQVARQIQNRHGNRHTINIKDEYDVQDLFHALLRLYFDDVRAEEWTPSYAGSASRIDFLLKKEKIVIEIKKTRKNLGAKEVGEQLMIDIEKYTAHPDCETLLCFVYDPEAKVANPTGIENDLNRETNNLRVIVIITPK